jgi:magnesium transporter
MTESASYAAKKSGLPPGSLVHVGDVHGHEQCITVINYNKTILNSCVAKSIDDILSLRNANTVTWVIIDNITDVAIVDAIGSHFNIHTLVLEDILNTHQRPKFEEFDHYLYIVFKSLSIKHNGFSVDYEQISLLLLDNIVFSFKEKPNALFDSILHRLHNESSHLRGAGADYLTYIIMDTVVDEYFALQDKFDELFESVEDELLANPTVETLSIIQKIKRELIFLRRGISPVRELIAALQRSDSNLLDSKTKRYFADVYDHIIRITESIESYRDLITGMLDIYLSSVSNKLNEIMKFLTVFSSIFIPLTFLAGVYGMNFDYLPELHWKWAYPLLWLVFLLTTLGLLAFFKRKKWF